MNIIEIDLLPVAVNDPLPSLSSSVMSFMSQRSVYMG